MFCSQLKSLLIMSGCFFVLTVMTGCDRKDKSKPFDPTIMDIPEIDPEHPPGFHELFIPSHGVSLTGFLLTANGSQPHPTVVLLHGYPGNEKNLDLAQSIRRAGFNVLFFHYRGAWGSQGDYALSHLSEDAASALEFLRQHTDKYPIDAKRLSLVGHSMGGFTALRAGANDADVTCVVGLAAANLGEYANRDDTARAGFKAYTDQLFMLNNFDGTKGLEEIAANGNDFDVTKYGPRLAGKSVLLVAGEQDTVVPPAIQEAIANAYGNTKEIDLTAIVILGDHAFSTTRIQLQRLVVGWLQENCG